MKTFSIILVSFILAFSSCVSKKKLLSEQNKVKALQTDSIKAYNNLSVCNAQVTDLEKQKLAIQKAMYFQPLRKQQ